MMAAKPKPISCKSCARTLATVSEGGLAPTISSDNQGCNTCQQFGELYDAMRAADEEYEPLSGKGDKHHGKQAAVAKVKRTHMSFDNWLIGIEACVAPNGEPQSEAKQKGHEEAKGPKEGKPLEQHSMKRARSHSPAAQSPRPEGTLKAELDSGLSPQSAARLSLRPPTTRSHSMTSLLGRKRIKFSDSVEFRDDHRNYLELCRSREEYVPGRYAPPEGGYLDTSGADQTFPKFTGVKKVRGKWVEVTEKKENSASNEAKKSAQLQSLELSEHAGVQQEMNGRLQDAFHLGEGAQLDDRGARLAERKKRMSVVDSLQEKGVVVRRRERSQDRAEKENQTSSSKAAILSLTPDVEEETQHADGALDCTTQGDLTDNQTYGHDIEHTQKPSRETVLAVQDREAENNPI